MFDSVGQLLVADYFNKRIQVFAADGSFVTAFSQDAELSPVSVCVDAENRILVADLNYRVCVFGFV